VKIAERNSNTADKRNAVARSNGKQSKRAKHEKLSNFCAASDDARMLFASLQIHPQSSFPLWQRLVQNFVRESLCIAQNILTHTSFSKPDAFVF
jgi:hypothetical protein